MDTFERILSKFDVRDFSNEQIPNDQKRKVLEAARATGTGLNTQHWRFVLVQTKARLELLSADSTSGQWVSRANFAIIVLTNPKHRFHALDAGRVIQNMQLAAWNDGITSGIFTGVNEAKLRADFNIPPELYPTAVIGFGYPLSKSHTQGPKAKKNRLSLEEIAFADKYGIPISTT